MILKTKGLWVVLAAALLAASPVHAQITAPREAAQIQFGTLSLYPSMQIVDAGFDDNVFNDPSAPQSDYTLTASSRGLAVLRLGSNELLFQGGHDYVWFREIMSERSNNAQYAVRFNMSASRFKPYIGAEHVSTRVRRSPEIDARARRVDRTLLGGIAFDVSPRTALTAAVRLDETTYAVGERFRGIDLENALNRSGRGADAGMRYAITPLTTLSVTAGYEEQKFQKSHIRDLKRYTVGPTIQFNPEAAIRGRVVTALELFKPDDPALAERMGIAYQALLNWALFGRTTFDLVAGRNISYSYQDTEPYYLLTNIRLLVTQPLPGWFELYGGYDWEHMAYRWSRNPDTRPEASDRVDKLTGANGGFGMRLGRSVHVKVGVEKTQRRSIQDPLQNFNRMRILSTVTVGS
ncbi:MAG: outer membrane beta-barrel protein [Vicinamibacterales bacterium]